MKPRKGQYCRTQYGVFHKIDTVYTEWVMLEDGSGVIIEDVIIKDKPHELIEIGDLGKASFINDIFMFNSYNITKLGEKDIIEIYTKDYNGDYIKQWEK